jgi:hypothetical protein
MPISAKKRMKRRDPERILPLSAADSAKQVSMMRLVRFV